MSLFSPRPPRKAPEAARAWPCARFLPAAIALCLIACTPGGASDRDGYTTDLLVQGPDLLVGELGSIAPDAGSDHEKALVLGWETLLPGDRAFRAQGDEARIVLELGRKRTLSTSWTVASQRPGAIELEINGALLPFTLSVGEMPSEQLLELAGASLRRGRNTVILRRARPAIQDGDSLSLQPLDLELFEVSWGERQTAELGGKRGTNLVLGQGGAAGFQLELPDSSSISLEGRVTGKTELWMELLFVDPSTGAARVQGEPFPIVVQSGRFREVLEVPGSPTGLGQLWFSASGDSGNVTLEGLDLERHDFAKPPTILFLSIDTLAAQNMSLYGYGRETTPNMSRFAEDAVLFERARSNAPWTVPSYVSQLSGQFSEANRRPLPEGYIPEAYELFEIPRNRWTIAEMLRGAGYRTVGLPDNLWLTLVAGIDQGFEVFDIEAAERAHGLDFDGGMYNVFPKIVQHLSESKDAERPTFIFAQVFDVHGPYFPNDEFSGRFSAGLKADNELLVTQHDPIMFGTLPAFAFREDWSETEDVPETFDPDIVQARYDEKIAELDHAFGKLIDEIDSLGIEDLIIVVAADHGESMQDHQFYFRHGLVYEDTVHVPLIVRLPDNELGGSRVTEPVQLVDLYPTLCEFAGLDSNRPYLHGRSLAGYLNRGEPTAPKPTLATEEFKDQVAVGFGRWKFVRSRHERSPDTTKLSQSALLAVLAEDRREDLDAVLGSDWTELDKNALNRRILESASKMTELEPEMWRIRFTVEQRGSTVELFDVFEDPREQNNLAQEHREFAQGALGQFEYLKILTESTRALGAFDGQAPPPSQEDLLELERLGYATKRE